MQVFSRPDLAPYLHLDRHAMRALGQTMAETGAALIEQAEKRDSDMARRNAAKKRHREAKARVWRMVEGLAPQMGHNAALAHVATLEGMEPDQVALLHKAGSQAHQRAAMARRNARIVRMAGDGATNAEIADKFDLSESTVSRIVKEHRRRAL